MQVCYLLVDTVEWIEDHLQEKITIEEVAYAVHISPIHLQRQFKKVYRVPLAEYIRDRKMKRAYELLKKTDLRVMDVAYDLHYSHEAGFVRAFTREYGISPGKLRQLEKAN